MWWQATRRPPPRDWGTDGEEATDLRQVGVVDVVPQVRAQEVERGADGDEGIDACLLPARVGVADRGDRPRTTFAVGPLERGVAQFGLLEKPGEGVVVAGIDGGFHGTVVRAGDGLGGSLDGGDQARPVGEAVLAGDDELGGSAWEAAGSDLGVGGTGEPGYVGADAL
jgi:hypothetical protein